MQRLCKENAEHFASLAKANEARSLLHAWRRYALPAVRFRVAHRPPKTRH
jgi:hypothetical protein